METTHHAASMQKAVVTPVSELEPLLLGIEGGATHTRACLESVSGATVAELQFGPANLQLLNDASLTRHFRSIATSLARPSAIAVGLAGVRTDADRERIRRAASIVWPKVPCAATNDLETALALAADESGAAVIATVLILSGTGSCCFGRAANGRVAKIGGWGHLLGDKGSGYEIGLRALKAVVYYLDRDRRWSGLGRQILRALQLNEPDDLIPWAQSASKAEIAALAVEVFRAWSRRDRIATDILTGAAHGLAKDAVACAKALARENSPVRFVLSGSVLLNQPRFAAWVAKRVKESWKNARVAPLSGASVRGAVILARRLLDQTAPLSPSSSRKMNHRAPVAAPKVRPPAPLSPTEQRNPRSAKLDTLSVTQGIALMLREEARVPGAIWAERKKIARVIGWIVKALRGGGRLFYAGAGTSGRLGVLDASECPPTFRTPPDWVQGIIAGGQKALWEAVEGAEDDAVAGERAMEFRGVGRRDIVVGIAASGRTPFVWGALRAGRRRGAATVLFCCNPLLKIPKADRPDLVIAPAVGPEVLTGSTRLKAGTATKLVLNLFTTLAMVRLGKVRSNLMIDVKASNAKLRDRAIRITRDLTGADEATARAALIRSDWMIQKACDRIS